MSDSVELQSVLSDVLGALDSALTLASHGQIHRNGLPVTKNDLCDALHARIDKWFASHKTSSVRASSPRVSTSSVKSRSHPRVELPPRTQPVHPTAPKRSALTSKRHNDNSFSRSSSITSARSPSRSGTPTRQLGRAKSFHQWADQWRSSCASVSRTLASLTSLLRFRVEAVCSLVSLWAQGEEWTEHRATTSEDAFVQASETIIPILVFQLRSNELSLTKPVLHLLGHLFDGVGELSHKHLDVIPKILMAWDSPQLMTLHADFVDLLTRVTRSVGAGAARELFDHFFRYFGKDSPQASLRTRRAIAQLSMHLIDRLVHGCDGLLQARYVIVTQRKTDTQISVAASSEAILLPFGCPVSTLCDAALIAHGGEGSEVFALRADDETVLDRDWVQSQHPLAGLLGNPSTVLFDMLLLVEPAELARSFLLLYALYPEEMAHHSSQVQMVGDKGGAYLSASQRIALARGVAKRPLVIVLPAPLNFLGKKTTRLLEPEKATTTTGLGRILRSIMDGGSTDYTHRSQSPQTNASQAGGFSSALTPRPSRDEVLTLDGADEEREPRSRGVRRTTKAVIPR